MRLDRRFLPPAVLAAGCVLLVSIRRQQAVPLAAPLSTVPVELTSYRATDVPIPVEEQRVAGMSSYLYRVYARDSADAFSLYVGYYDYQTQGKSVHSPKNCLPGAGWEALAAEERTVDVGGTGLPVNRYLLAKGSSRALVYYWYQGRGRVSANEYRVKWELLRDAALSGRSEEALVRFVFPLKDRTEAQADSLAAVMIRAVVPAVEQALPDFPNRRVVQAQARRERGTIG